MNIVNLRAIMFAHTSISGTFTVGTEIATVIANVLIPCIFLPPAAMLANAHDAHVPYSSFLA